MSGVKLTIGAKGKFFMWLRANGLTASQTDFESQLRVYLKANRDALKRINERTQ